MRKRLKSILLALAMTLTLLPLAAAPARADVRLETEYGNGLAYWTTVHWSGTVHRSECAAINESGDIHPQYSYGMAKVVLDGDTTLIIPEGESVIVQNGVVELNGYTLTITGGGTFSEISSGSFSLGNLVVSGSVFHWHSADGVYLNNLTVENGGEVYVSQFPLDIMGGSLTVNDGSITVTDAQWYGRGILLEGGSMTVNDGGRVTLNDATILGEGTSSVILNGGAVEAGGYEGVTVTVAPGLSYTAGGEGSFTGTLSEEQLAAAAGKTLFCPAAQVGTNQYGFLQEAFEAAQTGGAVRLLRDVKQTTGEPLNVNGSLTLDLNGHKITQRFVKSGAIFDLAAGAELTLAGDGSIVCAGPANTGDGVIFSGAGAAESRVIFAGGAVALGEMTADGQFTGGCAFSNCGVTVNGGSLSVRTWSRMINGGSLTLNGGSLSARTHYGAVENSCLTVNDGAVLDIFIAWPRSECFAASDLTVNGGAVLLRGGHAFMQSEAVVNGGALELRGNGMDDSKGRLQGRITLNGGAVRLSELDDVDEEKLLVFGEGCTYAVEGMTDSYCGETLSGLAEIAPLEGKWIAPAGAACSSGVLDSGASYVHFGDAVAVFGLSADARLFAAWYGADGRMLGIAPRSGSVDCWGASVAIGANAARFKLMIADAATFAPLCAAWDSGETA